MPALDPTTTALVDGTGTYLRRIGATPLLDKEQEIALAKTIEAGVYAQHLLDQQQTAADATPAELAQIVRDGQDARAQFIQANLRLVVAMARRYQNRGVPLDDLIQEGNEGLAKAVDHFDWTRNARFSSYATWWIRQSLLSCLGTSRTVRIPEEHENALRKIFAIGAELLGDLGRTPTPDEIAERAEMPADKVIMYLQHDTAVTSLDRPIDGANGTIGTLGDVIDDARASEELAGVEKSVDTEALRRLLGDAMTDILTVNEAETLTLRFGLADGTPKQLHEVAARMGISRQRVRQLESAGMHRLRHAQPMLLAYL